MGGGRLSPINRLGLTALRASRFSDLGAELRGTCLHCTCTELTLAYSLTYTPCGTEADCDPMGDQAGALDLNGGNPCSYSYDPWPTPNLWAVYAWCQGPPGNGEVGKWFVGAVEAVLQMCGGYQVEAALTLIGGKPIGTALIPIHADYYYSGEAGPACGTAMLVLS